MKVRHSPRVIQLARDLHLDLRGDCAQRITAFALDRVRSLIEGFPVADLDTMRTLLANRLRAKVEFIHDDADIERIATDHSTFHPHLRRRLREEFITGTTEGITLERDGGDARAFQFLAVVDARGSRAIRAYFTAWHELVHLLIHPPQLAFAGFRRSPPVELIQKDPIESLVDSIAGDVGFFEPIYAPVFREAVVDNGALSFAAMDLARHKGAPSASFYAASLAGIRLTTQPALFVTVDNRLKKSEAREVEGSQLGFPLGLPQPQRQLRVVAAASTANADAYGFRIFAGMRVPPSSVLTTAFNSPGDVALVADEDQDWWETSRSGALSSLGLRVEAMRRGRYVYGLLTPSNGNLH
jgi:hypothetical protein